MIKNFTLLGKASLVLFLFFYAGFSSKTFAQCAGEDNTIDLCDKSTMQIVDLYAALGGTPQPGGTWTDNDLSGGLNTTTGKLDTYLISTGGVFTYTYTNDSCGESATITLNLAGYPGADNMNAVACDDNSSVNLFQFTGGNPAATVPGNWALTAVDNDNGDTVGSVSGALNGRRFNAAQAGTGTYTFTYTITDQVALDCFPAGSPELSSMVVLEVTPAPESGDPDPTAQTTFCETDDLSGLTNFNLRNTIINEDDGGYWIETTTNEISGVNDSFINIERIRDTFGGGVYTFTYVVEPINQICNESETSISITIEDVADFTAASLELTFPADEEDIICEDQLPISPIATITGDPTLIPDGDYDVTYTVSPAPNTGTETLTVTITGGTGTFPVNTAFFTGAGVAELRITQIVDPNTAGGCNALLSELTDTLTIVALSDASDTQITVSEPLCFGENATLTIMDGGTTGAIELIDGEYSFTYTLVNGTDSQQYTQTATVSGGMASITIMATALPNPGDYTATLNSISNEAACVSATDISTTFTIDPLPDAQTVAVNVTSACEDDVVTVTITDTATPANLADGTYDFTYDITGAITATNETASDVVITGGTGSFTLTAGLLANGESTLTLTSVSNTATTCTAINVTNPSSAFTIVATPDLTASNILAAPICEGESALITIMANPALVADGNYTLTYNLTGDNTADDTNIAVTFASGEASFTLDAAAVANPGTTTVNITTLTTENQNCPADGLPVSVDLVVNPLPSLDETTLATDASCEGDDVTVTLTNPNVVDGTYEIVYQLSGANTLTDQTETLVFVSGSSNFIITTAELPNTGTNSLSISQITDLGTPNACEVAVTGLTIDFTVNPNPDFSNLSINQVAGTCQGDDAALILSDTSGTLADGTYTITYELTGANTQAPQTASVTIDAGTGTLVLDVTLVTNAGSSIITISSFVDAATLCESTNAPVSETFLIVSPPDLTGATISISDFCLNDSPVNAMLTAPNLVDGSYTFTYMISGDTTGSGIASAVSVVSGEALITLDAAQFTTAGDITVTLTEVANDATSCSVTGLDITSDFVINPLPVIESADLAAADICLDETATLAISGTEFVDGDYEVVYALSGANTASATTTLTFVDGAASIDFDAMTLANAGTTTFSISQVSNLTTSCVSTSTASIDFIVNPIPEVIDGQLTASDICINENGFISFTNATGLADGDYMITYDLSGANTATDLSATLTIAAGSGSFEIPAASLVNTGITTFNLTLVNSETGCASDPLMVSDDFEVLALPDATGLSVAAADVCFGEAVLVDLTGATLLADADYLVTYQLSGANESAEITETLAFTGGDASIVLDSALLANSGTTTLTVIDIQNFVTMCSATNVITASGSFTAESPAAPTLSASGEVFCINDSPTVGDLEARVNSSLTVVTYNAATGGSVLNATTLLADNTTYYLGVINSTSGCESAERLAVTIDLSGCDSIFIPNGFSPNGDGMNDVFEMKNINIIYPDYTIEIFNRNGSVVFKGNASSGFWDGKANTNNLGGNVLPNGVYFYILNYNDGQTSPKQGNIYLNR